MSKTHKDQRNYRRKAWRTPQGLTDHLKRQERRAQPKVRYAWRSENGGSRFRAAKGIEKWGSKGSISACGVV